MLRRVTAALAVVTVLVALAGCGLVGTSAPVTNTTKPAALSPLVSRFPKTLTGANAKTETIRLADQVQDMIAKPDIIFVDNHDKLVSATTDAGQYYGVLRTVNVVASLDPVQQATAMEKILETAGWILRDTANDKGKYLVALSSNTNAAESWFLLLGAETDAKKPLITIQLASPDIPKK